MKDKFSPSKGATNDPSQSPHSGKSRKRALCGCCFCCSVVDDDNDDDDSIFFVPSNPFLYLAFLFDINLNATNPIHEATEDKKE